MAKAKSPKAWIDQIFTAGQANAGNVVRRSVFDVEKYASHQALEEAVRDRGFHMAIVGTQYVIICDQQGQFKIIC